VHESSQYTIKETTQIVP